MEGSNSSYLLFVHLLQDSFLFHHFLDIHVLPILDVILQGLC